MPFNIIEQNGNVTVETWQRHRAVSSIIILLFLAIWSVNSIGILADGVRPNMALLNSPQIGYAVLALALSLGTALLTVILMCVFWRQVATIAPDTVLLQTFYGKFRSRHQTIAISDIKSVRVLAREGRRGLVRYKLSVEGPLEPIQFGIGLSRIEAYKLLQGPFSRLTKSTAPDLMPLHPDVAKLVSLLDQMKRMLIAYNRTDWASAIESCRKVIETSDFYGVSKFLSFFGGNRSLNDIYLQKEDRSPSTDDASFQKIKTEAWELADRFRKEMGQKN